MTWYKSVDQLPSIMDYDIIKGKRTYQYFDGDVLYPFGHGLSYTHFDYRQLKLSCDKANQNDRIQIEFTVENSGTFDGDEVVQLYVKANHSRVKRPLKTLKNFKRLSIKSGESAQVKFELPASELAFWDVVSESYKVETGTYTIMVGTSSANLPLQTTIDIIGDELEQRTFKNKVKAFNYDDYHNVYVDEGENREYCIRTNDQNGWIGFYQNDLSYPFSQWKVRVYSEAAAEIQLRVGSVDGDIIASIVIDGTHQWQQLQTDVKEAISENCVDLYVVLRGDIQLSWLQLL